DNNKLEVGEKWAYEFTYDVDQVRINNGSDLINTVSVSTKEGAAGNSQVSTEITRLPSIALVKVGDYKGDTDRAEVGDAIEYTFTVTNTGNVTVEGLVISEERL